MIKSSDLPLNCGKCTSESWHITTLARHNPYGQNSDVDMAEVFLNYVAFACTITYVC